MSLKRADRTKKFKVKKDKTSILASVAVVLFLASIGVHLLFGSHAATPLSPTLSDVCGVTNTNDIQVPTSSITAPATAITPVVKTASVNTFHILPAQGGNPAEVYVLSNGSTITIYNLTTGAQIGSSFHVAIDGNSESSFALDPQGNVYVTNSVQVADSEGLYKYSSTGALQWSVPFPNYTQVGGAYGYTNSAGVFNVAYRLNNTVTGPDYNQTAQSSVYNASKIQQANNNMNVPGDADQDPTSGDILTTSSDMMRVYTNSGTLKFQMGTDLGPGGTGPWHFYIPNGAIENPAGGYFVSDEGNGMESFGTQGQYLGMAPDVQSQNGASNIIGDNPGHVEMYNGSVYYYLNHGINESISNEASPGVYNISLSNLDSYISYPQGSTGHLGIGAGMYTTATDNYFPSGGATPTVEMKFYPWWASQASSYTIKYTVKSIPQVESNATVATTSLSLGSYMSASTTTPTSVPISLGTDTTPGAYEVSAHIYDNSNPTVAVGADCLDYSVGAAGDIYSPASFPTGNNTSQVEIAHEQGQNYVRGAQSELLDTCLPGVTNPTSSTNISCPADVVADINSAQALATKYGITFAPEVAATGSSLDQNMVSSGQWGRLVGELVAEFPTVKNWMLWNEINNAGGNYGNGSWVATNVFEPAYTNIKAYSSTDKVISGSSLNPSIGFWQQVGQAGGFKYLDQVDMHPYTDFNKSIEEQGYVIPPLDAAPSETANLGVLDQLVKVVSDTKDYAFNPGVTSLPISDSEFGVWNSGPVSYYNQANKLIRGTILQNSIGITDISVFENDVSGACYNVSGANWGSINCGFDGGDAPATLAQTTMQHMLDGPTVSGNRKFIQWLPTGVPHTYAAEYGPSATDTGSVVVVWADDFDTSVIPTLSGGGIVNVTSQYGAASTVSSGTSIPINGQVQYINIPAGQTITLHTSETYGSNLVTPSTASATASSTTACGSLSPSNVIRGIDDLSIDSRCNSAAFWAQSPSDTNPAFTVTLNSPQNIDRVFLSSDGIDSAVDGLRSFDVQVASTNGGAFTTVGSVTNAYFERNHLVTFTAQTVAQIRIINMVPNFTGYGNGLPPIWWPTDTKDLTDPTQPYYGQDSIMDIEAYTAGSGVKTVPPPAAPTGLSATAASSTKVNLSWTATTDTGGPGVAGYYVLRSTGGGSYTTLGTVTGTTYSDTTAAANTNYSYTVEAFDSSNPPNVSAQSGAASVKTPSAPNPTPGTPTGLAATSPNSSLVNLSWTASTDTGGPGIAGYYILRSTTGSNYTTLGSVTGTTYADKSVSANTLYYYEVESYDSAVPADVSLPSSAATVTTPNPADTTPPSQPTNLVAKAASSSQINLTWIASTDNVGVKDYAIYRNNSTSPIATVQGTSYGDTGLSANTTYTYYVIAYDTSNNASKSSATASATTQSSTNPQLVYVYGIVSDKSSGNVLAGVFVTTGVHGTANGAATSTTNSTGQYLLSNITPNRSHYYNYSFSGYKSAQFDTSYTAGSYNVNKSLLRKIRKI